MPENIWNFYPYSRPLNQPVEVLIDGEIRQGVGCDTARYGGGILVDGKLIDSNSKLQWRYPVAMQLATA